MIYFAGVGVITMIDAGAPLLFTTARASPAQTNILSHCRRSCRMPSAWSIDIAPSATTYILPTDAASIGTVAPGTKCECPTSTKSALVASPPCSRRAVTSS